MWPKKIIDFKIWLNPSTAPGVSRSNTFLLSSSSSSRLYFAFLGSKCSQNLKLLLCFIFV
jgi:hypothetical protein